MEVLSAYLKSKHRVEFNNSNDLATPILSHDVAHLVPYIFNAPNGAVIDLRLMCNPLLKKSKPILQSIVQQEKFEWVRGFRERLLLTLEQQEQPKSNEEINEAIQEAVRLEYLKRLYAAIREDARLEDLSPGLAQCIVRHGKAMDIMNSAYKMVQKKIQVCKANAVESLKKTHSILSRIDKWLNWKKSKLFADIDAKCEYAAHVEALKMCSAEENQQEQQQTIYFLRRDLDFLKEIVPQLKRQWKKGYEPSRSFEWSYRIWRPSSWIVRRLGHNGCSEIIPTVIAPAFDFSAHSSNSTENNFMVEKYCKRRTTTTWPFWRITNFFHRTMSWLWNTIYYCLICIPWNSSYSLRAIFCIEPFSSDYDLSQHNGCLYPSVDKKTETVFSRLMNFWSYLKRKQFEYDRAYDRGKLEIIGGR